jgi:hypothetical protein
MSAPADFSTRLAEWAVVFPPEVDFLPKLDAEMMTALELALQELRETRQPLPNADRQSVLTNVNAP